MPQPGFSQAGAGHKGYGYVCPHSLVAASGTLPTMAPGSSPFSLTVAVLLGKLRDLHVMQPNFLKEYMYCSREGGICWLGKPAASTRPPVQRFRSVCTHHPLNWKAFIDNAHGAAANNAYPWQRT